MSEDHVKLTVRLPARLHKALKERAVEYNVSLNRAVVDALTSGLDYEPGGETELQKVDRLMREKGRLADTSWMADLVADVPVPSLEEVQEWFAGVPLADWIIEDRGAKE
ncbi:MAG: hypothetical protein BWY52_00767 [Chloroflexi bacterium ADurb.Bin325]|nr:MAG: hypothetical protein BWY52_00767 [Chloroflexi bacterium ADurb.Bin325]